MTRRYRYNALFILTMVALTWGCQPPKSSSTLTPDRSQQPSGINADLCKAYIKNADYESAMRKCEKAISLDSQNNTAYLWKAVLHQKLAQDTLAEENFKKAISLAPEDSLSHNNYGVFLMQKSRFVEAEQEFLTAAQNPLYTARDLAYSNAALSVLGTNHNTNSPGITNKSNTTKAETYFRQALEINSDFAPALYWMAKLNFVTRRYLPAQEFMDRWAVHNQWSAETLWLAVQIAYKLEDKKRSQTLGMLLKNGYPASVETQEFLRLQ